MIFSFPNFSAELMSGVVEQLNFPLKNPFLLSIIIWFKLLYVQYIVYFPRLNSKIQLNWYIIFFWCFQKKGFCFVFNISNNSISDEPTSNKPISDEGVFVKSVVSDEYASDEHISDKHVSKKSFYDKPVSDENVSYEPLSNEFFEYC